MSFTPVRMPITSISRSNPAVVTVGVNHNMTTGQVIRTHVPKEYGMVELNNNLYSITILSVNSFSLQKSQVPPAVPVDSTQFTAFTIPSVSRFTAEVLPVGSGPTPITNTVAQEIHGECEDLLGDAITNIATVNQPF